VIASSARRAAYPPLLGADVVVLLHEATQLSRSVVQTVLHASSVHFWTQVLSVSWHLTLQSVAVTVLSQPL
jgi:hypothetical protein